MLLLFFQEFNWIDTIQKLGFPIVLTLGILYFLGKFLWKLFDYVTKKLDEKDAQLIDSREHNKEFRTELLATQKELINSQSKIVISQDRIMDSVNNLCRFK